MIKDGLKNEALIEELLNKGSSVITTRNDFGIHVFSGSLDDGVVSGRLGRPKYNITELQKTVNTIISELVPVQRPTPPRTVPLEVYNQATQSIANRDVIIEGLNVTNSNLQSRITDLETENQSLDIETDGARTLQSIAENQSQIANTRVTSTIQQLQFSIQKATQEAIQRASLEARNQALLSENGSLREQLFGKTSQLQAGAKSSGTLFTVNPQPISNPAEPPIRGSQKIGNNPTISNGQTITVFNSSSDTITITITRTGEFGWYNISPVSTFKLEPTKTQVITLNPKNKNWTNRGRGATLNGRLIFTGTAGENTESVILPTKIKLYVG